MPLVTVLLPLTAATPATLAPAAAFARAADVAEELVTVSVLRGVEQSGNRYGAVVHVLVPDAWDGEARERFLHAAGAMLERCFGVAPADAIVTLGSVRSGEVLERGAVERW